MQFKAVSTDLSQKKSDLLEVDLGNMRSMKSNEVHVSELEEHPRDLRPGEQVIDDATNEDDTNKYKLVMIGRKVTQKELENNPELKYMLDANPDTAHTI